MEEIKNTEDIENTGFCLGDTVCIKETSIYYNSNWNVKSFVEQVMVSKYVTSSKSLLYFNKHSLGALYIPEK